MRTPPEPLVRVARELGNTRERVVFIGGLVAPLLQLEPPMPRIRPTDDVDALLVSAGYPDARSVEVELERHGFRRDTQGPHAHRWIAPGGDRFDLVPFGQHLGATGSELERIAADTADSLEIEPGFRIRHASAPAFVALKFAAHADRFPDDPLGSRDLQDVIALVASRPGLPEEIQNAHPTLRDFVKAQVEALLADPDADEIIASHLNDAVPLAEVLEMTRERLVRIAALALR